MLAFSKLSGKMKLLWLFIFFFASLSLLVFSQKDVFKKDMLVSDAAENYSYLPAVFVFQDFNFEYVTVSNHIPFDKISYITSPIGKPVIKMPMGFAIVNAPFFIIGHIYAIAFDYECNGYSLPYYLSIRISTIFYVSLACSMLILIISQFSNFFISFLSVSLMLFGTNLLNYTIYQPGMSHAFSFSFGVFFIFSMLSWINKANLKGFLLMCFLFGLLVLIRPTNLFFGVFPVLYTVRNYNDFTSRFKLLFWNRNFLLGLGLFFIIILPQLLYWKVQTGQFLISTYSLKGEGFFFLNPQIANTLFSFRNGWLIYTPIMFFSLIGMFFVCRFYPNWFLPLMVYFILNLWVISSWWCWWFIGFGNRAFIDMYGVLVLPLSVFIFYIFSKYKIFFYLFIFVSCGLIYANFNQMNLYSKSIVHYDSMSKETWLESLFSKPKRHDYFKYMIHPNYDEAILGSYFKKDYCIFVNEINEHVNRLMFSRNINLKFHENDSVIRFFDFENKIFSGNSSVLPFDGNRCFKFQDNFDFLEILNVTGSFFNKIDTTGCYLKASAWLRSSSLRDNKLATLIISEGGNQHYFAFSVDTTIKNSKGWCFVSGSMHLGNISSAENDVKVYLWRRSKETIFVDNFTVSVGKLQ